MFKEKERVFDLFNGGWGIIVRINLDLQFPIIVKFDNGKIGLYLIDGKSFIDKDIRSLYHEQYSLKF